MKDGMYIEVFAVKDGVRYNVKIVDAKSVGATLAESVMNGLGEIIGF